MLMPLYGFLEGDTLGLLVLVHDDEPVSAIAEKLQNAAAVRVPRGSLGEVSRGGERLDPTLKIRESGLCALDRVDVRVVATELGSCS